MSRPLPARLVEQARAYAAGTATPVEPRDAATVVLLRPGAGGASEVYLLRRRASMAFAGGMCVFPGGGVDVRDREHEVAWAGPSAATWAQRLGTDEPTARALVCAAVRETFEESGVLLAGPDAATVVDAVDDDSWEADRRALEAHDLAFSELLDRRGLVLRSDLLGAWAGWTTPVFEPRRYRTWFFVAAVPAGQRTRDVSTESAEVMWLPTGEALRVADAGEVAMMPPTWFNIHDVDRHGDPDAVLAAAAVRRVEMFTPSATRVGAGDGGIDGSSEERWTLTSPPGFDDLAELADQGQEEERR